MTIDTSTAAVEARCQHLDHVALNRKSQDAARMRALVAERDALNTRQYELAYAIAGGEDAPGLLDSVDTDALADMISKERAARNDEFNLGHSVAYAAGFEAAREMAAEIVSGSGSPGMSTTQRLIRALTPQQTGEG